MTIKIVKKSLFIEKVCLALFTQNKNNYSMRPKTLKETSTEGLSDNEIRFCKKCRKYVALEDFYIRTTKQGYKQYNHKRVFCRKSKGNKKKILWDDYKNPKTIREMQIWYEKNLPQITAYTRVINSFNIKRLSDSYVKALLKDQGFTTEQINNNKILIETKRELVKIRRLIKQKQS